MRWEPGDIAVVSQGYCVYPTLRRRADLSSWWWTDVCCVIVRACLGFEGEPMVELVTATGVHGFIEKSCLRRL